MPESTRVCIFGEIIASLFHDTSLYPKKYGNSITKSIQFNQYFLMNYKEYCKEQEKVMQNKFKGFETKTSQPKVEKEHSMDF